MYCGGPPFSSICIFALTASAKGTVQSVATVKCALDRSVYRGIKHSHRIKINPFVSLGAEMLNRNIRLWNSSITKVVPIKVGSLLCYNKFGPLRKFLFSTYSIDKRLSVSLLAFSHRSELFRMSSKRRSRTGRQNWQFGTGTLRFSNRFDFQSKSFSSSEM